MATATKTSPATVSNADTLALVLSISPLAVIWSNKARLGLDALHILLGQIALLLILRQLLDVLPKRFTRSRTPRPATQIPAPIQPQSIRAAPDEATVNPVTAPPPPPAFPAERLDEVVANFLNITEPGYLGLVPAEPTSRIPAATLSSWQRTYKGETVEVLQHPTIASLYAICATFADLPLAKLFQALQDINNRPKWDSMCAGAREVERFEVAGRRGNVLTMQMKGMPLVKAKDLVLLSVAGTLPAAEADPAGKRRIFAASTSVDHPECPVTSAYNRMSLSISGFVIEETDLGSRIIQITDLSGLGSWVPSAVFRTITESMLPKSLAKLGAAAAAVVDLPVDFPPPVLGSTLDTDPEEKALDLPESENDLGDYDEEYDEEGEEEEDDGPADPIADAPFASSNEDKVALAPSISRDLHALLTQLRSLSTRLSTLESIVETPDRGGGGWKWYAPFARPQPRRTQERIAGTEVMTGTGGGGISLSAILTMGSLSAAAAAVGVAAVAAWGRHRR
ncbi:Bet v1-like protein [Rhodotorula sp. JG-1b]|nr:Bet v1-like protein [Rhodotorula sp. JG-1b]